MINMVSIIKKRIKNITYVYLSKSLRLPDRRWKRIDKLLDKKEINIKLALLEKKYKEYFLQKEKELYTRFMHKNIKRSYIFSEEEIRKLENIRVSYKHLLRKLSKSQIKDIFDRFTANFTYNSNAIEGNSLTLKDVRIVLFEKGSVKSKDLREIYETRNSRNVVDLIMKKKFKISHKDIIRMHRILMTDIDERRGYKQLPNVILTNGREITTSRPENVEKEMDELIRWYNDFVGKMHVLEIVSIFHGKFEKIHPFEDGNGRVGRLLINAVLVNNGYPPLIIRKSVRSSYILTLRAFDGGYQDKLKRFMLEKFKETYRKFFEVYVKYV
jgi:Fic family protein